MHSSRDFFLIDNDGRNPYALEVARFIASSSRHVKVFVPQAAAKLANDRISSLNENLEILPMPSLLHLAIYYIKGPKNFLVAWASTSQKLTLIAASVVARRTVNYVLHNPDPKRWYGGWKDTVERLFIKRSSVLVHGDDMKSRVEKNFQVSPRIANHPAYSLMLEKQNIFGGNLIQKGNLKHKNVFLFFGRSQKWGLEKYYELASEFEKLGSEVTFIVLQRPRLEFDKSRIPSLVTIENRSTNDWIEDSEIISTLNICDLVLAPYQDVTESGGIILCNTLGVSCIAFDSPQLRRHLKAWALTPPGDLRMFAERALRTAAKRNASINWDYNEYQKTSKQRWLAALELD